MIPLYRNVSGKAWNTSLNTTSEMELNYEMAMSIPSSSFKNYTSGGFHSVRCIRDGAGLPGGVTPELTTDYDSGKVISANGNTYTITVTSNTEWEAFVRRGTDVLTSGDAMAVGKPLLDENRGLNGGVSWGYVYGFENGMLTLTTVDHTGTSQYAEGNLEIVFRDKATGVILDRVSINIISGIVLRTDRLVAVGDVADATK